MRDRLVALKSIFAGLALGERERETEREYVTRLFVCCVVGAMV